MPQVSAVGPQFPHLYWLSGAARKQEGLTVLEEDGLRLGWWGQEAAHVPAPRLESSRQHRSWKPLVSPPALRTVKANGPCAHASPANTSCSVPNPSPLGCASPPGMATARDPRGLQPTSALPYRKTPSSGRRVAQPHRRFPLQVKKCLRWCQPAGNGHAPPPQSPPPQAWCFLEV